MLKSRFFDYKMNNALKNNWNIADMLICDDLMDPEGKFTSQV